MSATIPSTEPSSFRAGDLLTWTKALADYPANQGWTLTYTLINATSKITITAGASGVDFLVSVPASSTAAYAAGAYQWMARVTKATEVYTVGQATIEILPNLAAATTYDGRSYVKKVLDAIEAVLLGRAALDQQSMEINGRRLDRTSIPDLLTLRDRFKAEYGAERNAERLANGLGSRAKVLTRFAR